LYGQADRRLRPLRRLLAIIFLPSAVAMRDRNPHLRLRFVVDGLYV
jgi:hypothetical protein